MPKRGKNYRQADSQLDRDQTYEPVEAIKLLHEMAFAKFDETVDTHWRLNVDPRHADQQVRGVAMLPYGTGKQVRVLVFTQGEGLKIAEEAGADYVADDELIKQIEGGWVDWEVSIATPDVMGKVGRLGRILGRRGLMPNPKSGTIVKAEDLPLAIKEARMGRVEFRVDRTSNVHVPIGKISFTDEQLLGNLSALVETMLAARPTGVKGMFVKTLTITTTMGPGIRLDLPTALALQTSV
ncbi:MAG: 50S ribosomal protein L1 [Chloroflexi bacterium]|nr:50S ribosomal protein L1 [Chloroflexota bacterium]MBU1749039.1 50S ribosomal protein L1 [Chloroflexota bacterium]MBU1878242.1 50S ribosomal protein L1 [Chloroflexota bacterium]